MNKKKDKTQFDIWQSIRRDWGAISPITKVIPNKKKNQKPKHKNKEFDE